ncbi:Protein bric-a-brac 1-like Protein [Tribolium castaneum]|uniref:Protein bric-a-brac 1-like Protein n=1 Tax=Tribolium castaneum TaxID=7070 RepID=A0A139WIA8_TRICA|nr:Protein bric-a-brac 1-like Protein [Tribolium castaneum]
MGSDSNKEYSVNWKNHMDHMRKAFDNLLTSNELTDVTLCCEGRRIGAHKMLLSACSTYFRDTFKDVPCQHPVIILYGVEYSVLSDILHFIYNGEVSVDTSKLDSFLKTAQLLKISGLTDNSTENMASENSEQDTQAASRREQTEGAFSEQVSTASEDTKKGAKRRVQESEGAPTQTKVGRQESDTLFMSDVKSEPSEFVNYEDPLEDPLLQADPSNENREFFVTSQGGVEDEIKMKASKSTSWPINTVKCNICNKVFSHPYSLQQHKPVHAGNTRCPICKAVLSRKYHLKLHMKARHNLN